MTSAVAALLERQSGKKVRPYSTFDFGRQKDPNCLSVVVAEDRARPLVRGIRKELPSGFSPSSEPRTGWERKSMTAWK